MVYYFISLLIGARAIQIGFYPDTLDKFTAIDPLTQYVLDLQYGGPILAVLLGIFSLALAVRATNFFIARNKFKK